MTAAEHAARIREALLMMCEEPYRADEVAEHEALRDSALASLAALEAAAGEVAERGVVTPQGLSGSATPGANASPDAPLRDFPARFGEVNEPSDIRPGQESAATDGMPVAPASAITAASEPLAPAVLGSLTSPPVQAVHGGAGEEDLGRDCCGSRGSGEGSDADFLRWVAGWLDKSDPLLQAVFGNKNLESVYTQEEREKVIAWLDGKEVQERLRALATDLESDAATEAALKPPPPKASPVPPASTGTEPLQELIAWAAVTVGGAPYAGEGAKALDVLAARVASLTRERDEAVMRAEAFEFEMDRYDAAATSYFRERDEARAALREIRDAMFTYTDIGSLPREVVKACDAALGAVSPPGEEET